MTFSLSGIATVIAANPALVAATLESMDRYALGKLVPIAGDPDQARWQLDSEQRNNLALHYTRKNVST